MSETWERLQKTLLELGIEPKKSLGQNFLVSDLVIDKIIRAAAATKPGFLLEIGPGPGALTYHLKNITSNYQLIELDRTISEYWRQQGLNLLEADALQIDWSPFLKQTRPLTLVSNLPYQISSSLVIDRCLDPEPLDFMILMFQKEVAQRLRARMQDELYGMLSVVAQSFWKMETLSDASPRDFFPPPKVASRVLTFEKKPSPVENKKKYFKFVKAAFLHPRKLMASNLQEGISVSKERAVEILQKLKLGEKARAGELSVQQFVDFYHELG
jgi:16S rRNA (adenine1518-N6/adenine1519-N6)-dimethyltransferase